MPSVNITEAEFMVVATAAIEADESGDVDTARTLDKLARKINAALTNANTPKVPGFGHTPITWKEVPSPLDTAGLSNS